MPESSPTRTFDVLSPQVAFAPPVFGVREVWAVTRPEPLKLETTIGQSVGFHRLGLSFRLSQFGYAKVCLQHVSPQSSVPRFLFNCAFDLCCLCVSRADRKPHPRAN